MTRKVHGTYRPAEVVSGEVDFYRAYTLVDITDTGNSDPKGNTATFKQAQNLNSLIQTLSLRTQLILSSVSLYTFQDLNDYDFGSNHTGTHSIWTLKFATETTDVWNKDNDGVFLANADCHGIPINTDLDETALISNIFETSDNNKNLYFTMSHSL